MKHFVFLLAALLTGFQSFSKETHDVTLKLRYKGNPLCYWDVTLKYGLSILGRGKSDENGNVTFRSVSLESKTLDASGYKKTSNGEKKWDITGSVRLDENYICILNFENLMGEMAKSNPIIEDMWGMTIRDCPGDAPSKSESSNSQNKSSTNSNHGSNSSTVETSGNVTYEGPGSNLPVREIIDLKRNHDQMKAQKEAKKAQQKDALEQKMQRVNQKIEKLKKEKEKYSPGTTDHSDASYELRDLEYDREITQLKLDEINDEYATDKGKLDKDDRQKYDEQTEKLENKQKELRKNKKDGVLFDNAPISLTESNSDLNQNKNSIEESLSTKNSSESTISNEKEISEKKTEETKAENKEPINTNTTEKTVKNEVKEEKKELDKEREALEKEKKQLEKEKEQLEKEKKEKEKKKKEEEDDDDAPFKIYTPEELANMSSFDLKRTKLSNNQSITKRKTKLKVKAAFYDVAKKTQMQNEIDALTKQVEAIKVILAQRNEKEEPAEEGK